MTYKCPNENKPSYLSKNAFKFKIQNIELCNVMMNYFIVISFVRITFEVQSLEKNRLKKMQSLNSLLIISNIGNVNILYTTKKIHLKLYVLCGTFDYNL